MNTARVALMPVGTDSGLRLMVDKMAPSKIGGDLQQCGICCNDGKRCDGNHVWHRNSQSGSSSFTVRQSILQMLTWHCFLCS